MAAEGLRVLAVATKTTDRLQADPYEKLAFLGLIGMEDPPRRDVRDAVQACGRAGIDVVMVTGDHRATAGKVAGLVGIADKGAFQVVEGKDLKSPQHLSEEERHRQLSYRVFTRVSPEQKLDLIELHQSRGAVVAMTGDGVNDAPALKKADIGAWGSGEPKWPVKRLTWFCKTMPSGPLSKPSPRGARSSKTSANSSSFCFPATSARS
jgi:Ca2+-transporting ATPase